MVKLTALVALLLNIQASALAQEARARAFKELVFRGCNNSCTLTPPIAGDPFSMSYRVTNKEIEGRGMLEVAELTLNGKKFELVGDGSWSDTLTGLTQYIFFENDPFQMYKLVSSVHTRTILNYYFVRKGNEFHLLTDEPVPTLSYDPETERFYGDLGMGGYGFTGDPDDRPSYTRVYFKLEGNRLVETGM